MKCVIFLTLKVWVLYTWIWLVLHENMCHICEIALYGIIDMYTCETKNMKSYDISLMWELWNGMNMYVSHSNWEKGNWLKVLVLHNGNCYWLEV